MINKDGVLEFFNENEVEDVEVLKQDENTLVVRFYYDFDEDEIKSATAYANDECEEESESDVWYEEFYLPYLNDLAVDSMGEVIEDAMEELKLEAQYVAYEADKDNQDYSEFIAVFYEKGTDVEIESILDELNL
jgi:hypothetical protein